MPPVTLPISRLISVGVTLTPLAAQAQNLNALLILGSSDVIDVVTRMRSYTSLAQVATDFGTSAPEYLAAVLWFEQAPQPTQLFIGRWAKTATAGKLFGGALTPTEELLSAWTSIVSGGFSITIDAGAPQHLSALNFSTVTNMNAVAAIIQAALTGATIVWNSTYNRFEVESATTGAASAVSFATAPTSGADISALLELAQADSGSYQANGIVAESAVAAVTLFDANFGQQWFAVTVLGSVDADSLAVAAYIEGATNLHYFGVTSQEAATLTPGDTTSIAYQLQQLGYNRTGVQYSSSSLYAVVSLLGRILTVDYGGNNTVITLMYKQEPGIVPENLTQTQIAALEAKNCNVFVAYNLLSPGGPNIAIIEPGVSSSGEFIDTVIGIFALALNIQTAVFNDLFLTSTKIPQSDSGISILTNSIASICAEFVANGLLAPGQWNAQGFGALKQGDLMPKGYYIYAPPVSQQSQSARAARVSVPIQVAAKLAGAVHDVNVSITVNQ